MAKQNKEPQFVVSRINTQVMNYRVYVMEPGEKTLYLFLLFILGGAVGLIFYGGLFKRNGAATLVTLICNMIVFAVAGLLSIKSFLPAVTETLKKRRIDKLKKQFCDFASALTNALSSGMNMNDALLAVYNDLQAQYSEAAFIVQEVGEVIHGVNNNIPVETMLEDFGNRSGIPDVVNFATVFATCYRTGGDIKSIVRRTTDIISEKIMISSEIKTAMTSNKMQMNVMCVLPIVIVLLMRVMSREFAESFATIIGVIGLTISVGLTVGAYKLGKRITDIER